MKAKMIQWLAIFLVIQIGLIHFFNSQHEFEEAAYLGYLFVGNFLLALIAAYGIYRQQLWGWMLGLGLAVASLAGYAWSRTLGLPDTEIEPWITPWGLASLVIEGLLVGLTITRSWRWVTVDDNLAKISARLRYASQVLMILALFLTNTLVYQWDIVASHTTPLHMMSVEELHHIDAIPDEELEQTYGVRIERVAISMMDSIVDVRVRIVDPAKAHNLLVIHPSVFVDDTTLIQAPNMHTHTLTRSQGIHVMFFSTQKGLVKSGSEVSLVFGNIRLQPMVVR